MIGLLAIPWYIRFAHRKQIVDVPNHRSSHTRTTPRGGGIFLVIGTLCLLFGYMVQQSQIAQSWPLLATSAGIAILGFIDDLRGLPSILRLGIQLTIAACLFIALSENLQFGILNFQLTADSSFVWLIGGCVTIWIVGCLNIYNFMDGIDGIATLQGIATAVTWSIIAYSSQNEFLLLFSLLLLGGLLAFLRYNWPPAKVFMGDCASSFLGFAFAALPLLHSKHTGTDLWLGINLSALMLFPFLFDGTYTIFRRLSKRENILEAHRSHLYQRWTQRGANHRLVSSVYGLWALLCGASALLVHFEYLSLLSAYGIILVPAGFIVFRDLKSGLTLEGRIASEN